MITTLFPIAELSLNPLVIVLVGIGGGVVSHILGIGGGVLVTPSLVMLGISPQVAFASQLCNATGTNLVGFLVYWRRSDVDVALAWYLFIGGIIGALLEMAIYEFLIKGVGVEQRLNVIYVITLMILGTTMLTQNLHQLLHPKTSKKSVSMRQWMMYLPMHRVFVRSRVEMSIIVPITIGIATGLLTTILGGGVSMVMIPVVTYLIGRSSPVVGGTSRLTCFVLTMTVALIQSFNCAIGDWVIIILLIFGSTVGSTIARSISLYVARVKLGILGAIAILALSIQFCYAMYYATLSIAPAPRLARGSLAFLEAALDNTPPWGLWMVKLAYNHPVLYTAIGLVMVIILSPLFAKIARFVTRKIKSLYARTVYTRPISK